MRRSSPSMTKLKASRLHSNHLRCADLVPNPARAGEQTIVVIALAHQLDADWQVVRTAMSWQSHSRRVLRGPDRLHARIAGRAKPLRRLARHAWHQQHVILFEHRPQEHAALV